MQPLFVPSTPVGSHRFHNRSVQSSLKKQETLSLCLPKRRRHSYTTPVVAQEGNNDSNAQPMDWQEEVRLLLDPTLNTSAKQVLIQDFAKRLPDALKSPCARGVEDVIRQLTDDVIPDLVTNGPRYVSRAVESVTNPSSSSSSSSSIPSSSANSSRQNTNMPPMPAVSLEDVSQELRNVFNRTPEGLYTPAFETLQRGEDYEVRRYGTVIVAETNMRPTETTEVESAAAMGRSFNTLAGYLFGKNKSNTAMKMTTPVVLSKGDVEGKEDTMNFIIGEYSSIDDVPKTLDDSVSLREEPGRTYAVVEFSGYVTVGEAKRQRERLLKALEKDGVKVSNFGKYEYKCMIYNGPSTLPNLRRNELMIEVELDNNEVSSADEAQIGSTYETQVSDEDIQD